MKTIWKFRLEIKDEVILEMPKGSEVLDAQIQPRDYGCGSDLQLWALVDTSRPKEKRVFQVQGTGNPVEVPGGRLEHLSTVQHQGFVWHIFERKGLEL